MWRIQVSGSADQPFVEFQVRRLDPMSTSKPAIRTRRGNRVEYLSARHSDDIPKSPDGAEVLYHEYGTQLRRAANGHYLLNVLCGRTAQYGVEIALTADEIATYRSDAGDTFIHNFGEDIYDDPDAFENRILTRC